MGGSGEKAETLKWHSTLDSRLSTLHFGKIIDSKIIFGTTIEYGGRCENEQPKVGPKGEGVGTTESNDSDLHGWAEMRRAVLGRAKPALCFQIPSQASLHGILKTHRSFAPQMALHLALDAGRSPLAYLS
jgi:hypothetical protein